MKTIKFLSMLALTGVLFTSCSDDDDSTPEEVNEEETITTMIVTLAPQGGGDPVIFQSQDLDGDDGPNPPIVTENIVLAGNTTYTGAIVLLNETETPAEDVTEEVAEEDDEHQFFFQTTGSIASVTYGDTDGNGNPVGILFTLSTDTAGAASITITLRHEPKKPNDGTLADAGGETDFTETFNLTIQ